MGRPFLKMNGAGNQFVVVDARSEPFAPSGDEIRALAAAHGFDQLIGIEPAANGDAFMRVWNADGGEVETCGNALRCVGAVLMGTLRLERTVIDTAAGLTMATRAADGRIRVDMGPPRLDWREIPLAEEMDTRGIELQVGPIEEPVLHTPGAVSMGNPHVIFFTDRLDDGFVRRTGALIERHPLFPQGVNVGFAHVLTRDRIRLRVWERGAGLTAACGTGACAALVACARRGLTDRRATVAVDGGELEIDWDEATDHVFMTGSVELEGSGQLEL